MPNVDALDLPQELLIIGAAVKIGLFDTLKDRTLTLEELSSRTGCDLRALWTLTEALAALKYLDYEAGKIRITGEAYSMFYDQSNEKYTGFSFMHIYDLISRWLTLPELLRTGRPPPREEHREESRNFISAMTHYAKKSASEVVEYCLRGLPENVRVLDAGGGPLSYAVAFAQKGAVVTVLDLPEVIDMMEPELDAQLPISMVKGDFTVGLPEGPFDLIYLGNICHIYGEKENRKLFRDAAMELQKGGRLVVNDIIRGTGPWAALFAVNMLVNTSSGGTWTYEQYRVWLQDAGFLVSKWEEVGDNQLITATKQ